jgi:hypothetical protein
MDGHGTSPMGRCEGIPDPSEVSSPGKLSVFLISYNLITLNDIYHQSSNVSGGVGHEIENIYFLYV